MIKEKLVHIDNSYSTEKSENIWTKTFLKSFNKIERNEWCWSGIYTIPLYFKETHASSPVLSLSLDLIFSFENGLTVWIIYIEHPPFLLSL